MNEEIITYIFCETNMEFLHYQRENSDKECVMLVDGNVLRGRGPGEIITLGNPEGRWNYLDILESIERQKEIWRVEFNYDGEEPGEPKDEDDIYGTGFDK